MNEPDELLNNGWERRGDVKAPELVGLDGVLRTEKTRVVAKEIVAGIKAAKDVVFVVTFLLSDAEIVAALEEAAKRGVHVYLLLSAEARLLDAVRDEEFDRRVYEEHLAMLQRLAGWCCIRSARGFHAKAVLIDPTSTSTTKQGWLLTANLGKEPLERNEELAVRLDAREIDQVWHHGVRAFWGLAEHEFLSPAGDGGAVKGLPVTPDPRRSPSSPGVGSIVATTPDRQIRSALVALIAGATRRIVVACFGFDADDGIVADLCAAARRIEVVVLARKRPKSEPALIALAQAGAIVLAFDHLHAKAVVVDDERGLVMSANLEVDGLDRGFELGVRLGPERARALARLLAGWEQAAPWALRLRPRRVDVVGEFVPIQQPKKRAGARR